MPSGAAVVELIGEIDISNADTLGADVGSTHRRRDERRSSSISPSSSSWTAPGIAMLLKVAARVEQHRDPKPVERRAAHHRVHRSRRRVAHESVNRRTFPGVTGVGVAGAALRRRRHRRRPGRPSKRRCRSSFPSWRRTAYATPAPTSRSTSSAHPPSCGSRSSTAGGGVPTVRSPGVSEPSGRGLFLVRELSDDWGVGAGEGEPGKGVWFTMHLSEPTGAPVRGRTR